MSRLFLTLSLLSLLISACLPTSEGAPAAQTSEVLPTPTPVPPTETPTPIPTPTETPIISEADLNPAYTEHVQMNFMGAEIDASLITDDSLDPTIRKVTVGEQAYAEFMTRSVYGVYKKYHPDVTYEQYMQMLAEVQSGQRDPLEIAIPVYANDVNDGVPYQKPDKSVNPAAQKKYLIIPWYQGEAPKSADGVEVRPVSEINIALVNGKKVKNITLFKDNPYGQGEGLNLNGNVLYFYATADYIPLASGKKESLATLLSSLKGWMINYHGNNIKGYSIFDDNTLYKLLLNGGLVVEGNLYL